MGKLLGLTMTLMLKLFHPPLDPLIQLLQLLYVVLEFFQQPVTEERRYVDPELHTSLNNIQQILNKCQVKHANIALTLRE